MGRSRIGSEQGGRGWFNPNTCTYKKIKGGEARGQNRRGYEWGGKRGGREGGREEGGREGGTTHHFVDRGRAPSADEEDNVFSSFACHPGVHGLWKRAGKDASEEKRAKEARRGGGDAPAMI
jgi:hypothetical protein